MGRSDTDRHVVSVGPIHFGDDQFVMIAGLGPQVPLDRLPGVAAMMAGTRAAMIRCGSTVLGLDQLAEASSHAKREHLPAVGLVDSSIPFDAACDALDMVEVEASSLLDGDWGDMVRTSRRPIMLRRDERTTIDDWLAAGAALCDEGRDVVLVSDDVGNDWLQTALDRSPLPILVDATASDPDPSTAVLRARASGAHGGVICLSPGMDTSGALDEAAWSDLVFALEVLRTRGAIDRVDREIVRLLGERQQLSLDIGRAKADRGLPVFAPERERELIETLRALGPGHGLDADHLEAVFQLILAESRSIQEQRRSTSE